MPKNRGGQGGVRACGCSRGGASFLCPDSGRVGRVVCVRVVG